MWRNKKKFKNKACIGNYERRKNGETWFHLINSKTGKVVARYRTYAYAKRDGWLKYKK